MGVLLVSVSVLLAASAAVIFSGLVDRYRFARFVDHLKRAGLHYLSKALELLECAKLSGAFGRRRTGMLSNIDSDRVPQSPAPVDIRVLNCRVQRATLKEENRLVDAFSVDICGSIHTSIAACQATLKVTILDLTDGSPRAVQTQIKQGATAGGPALSPFCHKADLGKLPHQVTILSDWTAVAQLRLDKLLFPRKGSRNLQFDASVLSAGTGQELAHARCRFDYENPDVGYADLEDNAERTKVLAVALAFAVGAADGDLHDCEIDLIKNWARDNILDTCEQAPDQDEAKLEKALSKTVAFFRAGNKLDSYGMCMELLDIAPVAQRYDILELCLYVARASGSVAAEELAILKDLAISLDVDLEKFRAMLEKVLPIEMHQVKDIETVLGITSDMGREKARRHLNREYSKWNSRVTNADPGIQSQADQMLKLITEARSQYICEQRVPREDAKASKR
ncbi:MAG: tellurite resistance TerB family protein [Phycisphaerales bacterium]|nr:MAG: tellurite resistance TerB family protein [Phycisphaerales bacterium]